MASIQFYPKEYDYVSRKLAGYFPADPDKTQLLKAAPDSFLGTFLSACLRADAENYEIIRPALAKLMEKYPAAL